MSSYLEHSMATAADTLGIDRPSLASSLERGLLAHAQLVFGDADSVEFEAMLDEQGYPTLYKVMYVVDEVRDAGRELRAELAAGAGLDAEVGDELLFEWTPNSRQLEGLQESYAGIEALRATPTEALAYATFGDAWVMCEWSSWARGTRMPDHARRGGALFITTDTFRQHMPDAAPKLDERVALMGLEQLEARADARAREREAAGRLREQIQAGELSLPPSPIDLIEIALDAATREGPLDAALRTAHGVRALTRWVAFEAIARRAPEVAEAVRGRGIWWSMLPYYEFEPVFAVVDAIGSDWELALNQAREAPELFAQRLRGLGRRKSR